MATMRRLSDGDVRAIFESLHGNHLPPPHLYFHIVPVGEDGLKLSPPSFEFEDGLYVLLRPAKKKRHGSAAEALRASGNEPGVKVPDHLKHLVMKGMPPETCPWSLSGPQFPQPTAIQQRYCYPKGDPEYAGRKGGALWTMYGIDGKEDFQFRLLHVYFSAKRAVNKGVTLSEEDQLKKNLQDKAAAAAAASITDTPNRQRKRDARMIRSPWQERPVNRNGKRPLPMAGAGSSCPRALKRQRRPNSPSTPFPDHPGALLPPPSPFQSSRSVLAANGDGSIYVSPNTAASSETSVLGGHGGRTFDHHMFEHLPFHPVPSFDIDENVKPGAVRREKSQFPFRGAGWRASSEHFRQNGRRALIEGNDSFAYNEAAATEIGGAVASLETWNDSLFNFSSKPSFEQAAVTKHSPRTPDVAPITSAETLKVRLGNVHERIRAGILAHPASQQGQLLSIVSSWARSVAANPLVPTIQNGAAAVAQKTKDERRSLGGESTAV